MENIIDVTNEIGQEVDLTLKNNNSDKYYQDTILLYSLVENMLKYLISQKECWNENSKKVDAAIAKEKETGITVSDSELEVDFGAIRDKAFDLTFNNAINKARSLKIITEELKDKLHAIRLNRNNIIHQLYLFKNRNDSEIMRAELESVASVMTELIPVFERLTFGLIGFTPEDLPEMFEPLTK